MADFFTDPRRVEIRGREISISPLPVRKLAKAARLASPIVGYFSAEVVDYAGLIAAHADDVIDLCALAADVEPEWVGDLNAAELVKLATVVVEANADFFIRAVMPEVSAAMETLGKVAKASTAGSSA